MKRYRSMGYFLGALCAVQLAGCQNYGATGALSLRFDMPAKAVGPLAFSLKAIPAGTNRFEVEISGKGLDKAVKETIEAKDGGSKKTISGLPVGEKQVSVRAMLNQDVLASASTSVNIEVGKVAQAELELKALQAAVMAQVESVLPVDLQLKCKFTGEGLSTPLEKTIAIKANEDSADLGLMPLGAKDATIEMTAITGSDQFSSPATTLAFKVSSDGGKMSISANQLIAAFSDNLENILTHAAIDKLLGWVGVLQQDPERFRKFYNLLPEGAKLGLRRNPLVANLLPPDTSTPSSSSSPAPTTSTP